MKYFQGIRELGKIIENSKTIGEIKTNWNIDKRMGNQQGITLIALVVTIVVLLILAGITINLLFSNGGIFDIANQAKIEHEIGALKDRINNVIADWYIDKGVDSTTTSDDLWDKMVDADIIDNPDEDVAGPEKEGENDRYELTTNEGYIVEIIISPDGNVSIGDIEKGDNLLPKIGEITSTSNSNSIHIEVEITRSEGEVRLSYYYKKDGELESSYQRLKEGVTELTADFTGLEQKEVYNIKVIVEDENGTAEKVINVTTGELTGTVTQKGETVWNNGTATIELETKETGVTIQYQVGGTEGEWLDYEGSITGLKYGNTVFAVVTDGKNQSGYSSIDILDKLNPQQAQIELSGTTSTTADSTTATVTHIDNESGVDIGNCKWEYNTNPNEIGTEASNYTHSFSSDGEKITLSASTVGTYYLHVLTQDKAGNRTETISNPVTVTTPNEAPTTPTVTYNNKTSNTITVTAVAMDSDNDNLTYEMYVSTSPTSGFTQKAISSATIQGNQVTLTATELNQYTDYYYYVTVTDGTETKQSATSTAIRTYCPGTGYTCPGATTTTTQCSACSGYGTIPVSCNTCRGTSYRYRYNKYEFLCTKCGSPTRWTTNNCSMCGGDGQLQTTVPCSHGLMTSHNYCSHNRTSQHDD